MQYRTHLLLLLKLASATQHDKVKLQSSRCEGGLENLSWRTRLCGDRQNASHRFRKESAGRNQTERVFAVSAFISRGGGEYAPGPGRRYRWFQGPATTDIKDAYVRNRSDLTALRGPATAEIDAPHLRGRRRLNRRVNLICPRALPLTAVRGNSLGIDVGIERESGLGPGPLRSIASGGDRPSSLPVPVT